MTGTTIPTISLEFNSTYAHKTFSYYIKVYSNSGNQLKRCSIKHLFLKAIPKAPSNLLIGPNYSYINYCGLIVLVTPQDMKCGETVHSIKHCLILTQQVLPIKIYLLLWIIRTKLEHIMKMVSQHSSKRNQYKHYFRRSVDLQAESWGPNIVHLTWVDFAVGESGFEIQRSVKFSSFVSISPLAGPNATSFDDNTVDANITYSYQIRYFTPTAKSDFSNTVTITTSWNINPPSITGSATDTVGLYITWKDNSNYQAIGTIIERSSNNISPRNYIQVGSVSYGSGKWYLSNDSIPPTEKVIGNTYYYRVRQIIDLTKNIYTAPSMNFQYNGNNELTLKMTGDTNINITPIFKRNT